MNVIENWTDGHPILRRHRPWWYVRVGVQHVPDGDDEVWTRSNKMVRDIGEHLDRSWYNRYYKKHSVDRPWVYRNVGERILSEIILPYSEFIRCTVLEDRDANFTSAYAERIFDLLRIDGVLRNPPPHAVKGITDDQGRPCWDPKNHRKLFVIDDDSLKEWAAVRRILLEDNRKILEDGG